MGDRISERDEDQENEPVDPSLLKTEQIVEKRGWFGRMFGRRNNSKQTNNNNKLAVTMIESKKEFSKTPVMNDNNIELAQSIILPPSAFNDMTYQAVNEKQKRPMHRRAKSDLSEAGTYCVAQNKSNVKLNDKHFD